MKAQGKLFPVLLVVGSAVCLALLPWSRWFGPSMEPNELLTARVGEYVKARTADDWVAVYGLTAARDRKAVPLQRFIALCGQGVLKTIGMTEKARNIDVPKGEASVTFALEAELQLDRLPPNVRHSLHVESPNDLRKTDEYASSWYWESGTWWLRMPPEAVTGRAADGREISLVKPAGG